MKEQKHSWTYSNIRFKWFCIILDTLCSKLSFLNIFIHIWSSCSWCGFEPWRRIVPCHYNQSSGSLAWGTALIKFLPIDTLPARSDSICVGSAEHCAGMKTFASRTTPGIKQHFTIVLLASENSVLLGSACAWLRLCYKFEWSCIIWRYCVALNEIRGWLWQASRIGFMWKHRGR